MYLHKYISKILSHNRNCTARKLKQKSYKKIYLVLKLKQMNFNKYYIHRVLNCKSFTNDRLSYVYFTSSIIFVIYIMISLNNKFILQHNIASALRKFILESYSLLQFWQTQMTLPICVYLCYKILHVDNIQFNFYFWMHCYNIIVTVFGVLLLLIAIEIIC